MSIVIPSKVFLARGEGQQKEKRVSGRLPSPPLFSSHNIKGDTGFFFFGNCPFSHYSKEEMDCPVRTEKVACLL